MNRRYQQLGEKWFPLLDNPEQEAMNLIPRIVEEGGTRPVWGVKTPENEITVLAWPRECPVRAAVTVQGKPGGKINPVTVLPLLEGEPQDLTVEEVHPWDNGGTAYVGACRNEGATPLFFLTQFYFRDKDQLTPGVRQTFLLSGMAYGVRRALLDELTISEGPEYEKHAAEWLEKHPGASRLDVPQLKVDLRGQRILQPSQVPGDYELRSPIDDVEEVTFDGKTVYILRIALGMDTPNPFKLLLYVPQKICKGGYVPKKGDEIDTVFWLQGRLIDWDDTGYQSGAAPEAEEATEN